MAEHNFTLILAGDVEGRIDDIYEAGCDDALIGESGDGVPYAEFNREAPSRRQALLSAVAAIETAGVRVLRVEPDGLMAAEIPDRLRTQ